MTGAFGSGHLFRNRCFVGHQEQICDALFDDWKCFWWSWRCCLSQRVRNLLPDVSWWIRPAATSKAVRMQDYQWWGEIAEIVSSTRNVCRLLSNDCTRQEKCLSLF